MCGIAGIVSFDGAKIPGLRRKLAAMSLLIAHRGPDGDGEWATTDGRVGLAHRRLAIIDTTDAAIQPMHAPDGSVLVYNGEIYNYIELRAELTPFWTFRTESDSEVLLAAYAKWGEACVDRFRGMFAFAIWDAKNRRLFCARDRFGIKPFYWARTPHGFAFASEIKALLPLLPDIATDPVALGDYLTFQYTIDSRTLFAGVQPLMPAHTLIVDGPEVRVRRYWDVHYDIDWDHSPDWFAKRLRELMDDSVKLHLRADVEIGAYLSGGIDSSLMATLASRLDPRNVHAFHGRFPAPPGFDESEHARTVAAAAVKTLHVADMGASDFVADIENVIWHLDHPVAGPGSFPQYCVSRLAAKHVKVVLGGQGGDEMFGGYARYVVAYFEQCIKAAIEGNYKGGKFVVTAESIIPNLGVLREYKPLIAGFWRQGIFESLDRRYLRLIDRSADMAGEVRAEVFDRAAIEARFFSVFNSRRNVAHEAYFDSMTHFDFKCLLPALLHVEDRMGMAHGLESRVPFLDHPLVEFAATVPANVKFAAGNMKHMLKTVYADTLPPSILSRRDKMGFPVPLSEWMGGELRDWFRDVFGSAAARARDYLEPDALDRAVERPQAFSRKVWGLLCLELWQRRFHDRAAEIRKLAE
jgi:asparagine synthase (glutamine-hydrolysing)